ncbi:hypothetical protein HNQ80_004154 [Anaerosolibacter carboniphilus]|uniref:Uncharacterized protein n=1 Tax=Anaerosolibacter carboniphilus TaxID=1417629 RepID=A0A841KXD9_9FIRM|nr:hypothetical protein [Anaerosolibacter carboniphilus]
MNALPLIFSSAILILILYLLDRIFNYKARLISICGSKKYVAALLVTMLVIGSAVILRYDISPISTPVYWSFLYLFYVPKHLR